MTDEARFMTQLTEADLPLPNHRSVTESGAVYLTWSIDKQIVVTVSLADDGMYGAALRRDGLFRAISEDGNLSEPINQELAAYLMALRDSQGDNHAKT